jgi:hypothetical protein
VDTADVAFAFAAMTKRSGSGGTTTSSTMPPVASHNIEYRARPSPIFDGQPTSVAVEHRCRMRPGHFDLAHVAQVEQGGGPPDRVMFGDVGPANARHRPAGEVGHPCAERDVRREEE